MKKAFKKLILLSALTLSIVSCTTNTHYYLSHRNNSQSIEYSFAYPSTVSSQDKIYSGRSAPSDDFGNDGDTYVDLTSYDFYTKANGQWIYMYNLEETTHIDSWNRAVNSIVNTNTYAYSLYEYQCYFNTGETVTFLMVYVDDNDCTFQVFPTDTGYAPEISLNADGYFVVGGQKTVYKPVPTNINSDAKIVDKLLSEKVEGDEQIYVFAFTDGTTFTIKVTPSLNYSIFIETTRCEDGYQPMVTFNKDDYIVIDGQITSVKIKRNTLEE